MTSVPQSRRLPDWAVAPSPSAGDLLVSDRTIQQLVKALFLAGLLFSALAFVMLDDAKGLVLQSAFGTLLMAAGGLGAWMGHPRFAAAWIVGVIWLTGVTSAVLTAGGIAAGSASFLIATLLAAFMHGLRAAALLAIVSMAVGSAGLWFEIQGLLTAQITTADPQIHWLLHTVTYGPAVVVLLMSTSSTRAALLRANESESVYRLVAEKTDEFAWSLDREGRYLYASPSVERIFGWTPEEMLERRAHTQELPGDSPDVPRLLKDALARNETRLRFESQVLDKSGEAIWCEHDVTLVLDADAEWIGLNGITRDISKRVRAEQKRIELEEQFRQSQKMEAIGRLAGGIAHDFNNYLMVILGNAEILAEDLDAQTGSPIREIEEAALRSSELTRQLLAFSRKQVLQPAVVDLNDMVRRADRLLRRVLGEDIRIETISAPELGRVKVDPAQLDQVILNLAINAREAMPGGGRLIIETGNVYLDEEFANQNIGVQAGPYVMLAVSDTGVGMDAETLQQIFDPFFTTRPGTGTGLGLSTVHGIVTQSEGAIRAESVPGEGTTFRIYLPRESDAADGLAGAEQKTAEAPSEMNLTVLVVEDQEMVRGVISSMLEPLGCCVLPTRTGEEALEVARARHDEIDLVITDLVLPGANGAEIGATMRNEFSLPVLYMSGFTDHNIIHSGLLEPGYVLLHKPFTSKDLLQKIGQITSS